MAELARAGASDFFHPPTIPKVDSSSKRSSGGAGGRAAWRPAPKMWGLHRVHPPDQTGDPKRIYSPSLPSSGGVTLQGTKKVRGEVAEGAPPSLGALAQSQQRGGASAHASVGGPARRKGMIRDTCAPRASGCRCGGMQMHACMYSDVPWKTNPSCVQKRAPAVLDGRSDA
eukprot:6197435-Pleurochrysis_carterae.AAC.1